jgi:hypothetical protein
MRNIVPPLHDINCIYHLLDDISYALFIVPDKTVKTSVGPSNTRKVIYECMDIIRKHLDSIGQEVERES